MSRPAVAGTAMQEGRGQDGDGDLSTISYRLRPYWHGNVVEYCTGVIPVAGRAFGDGIAKPLSGNDRGLRDPVPPPAMAA